MELTFRALQIHEFTQAMQIRNKVFVEEQEVPPEEEYDCYDQTAQHFGVFVDKRLAGTGRLIIEGNVGKIGRVAILREYRRRGLGSRLMRHIMKEGQRQGLVEFHLGAQLHALKFYEQLGFKAEGDVFLDGGIPHRTMRHHVLGGEHKQ